MHLLLLMIACCVSLTVCDNLTVSLPSGSFENSQSENTSCPPWLDHGNGSCFCGEFLHDLDLFECTENREVLLFPGICLTWDETTGRAVIGNCPYFLQEVPRNLNYSYHSIPANVSSSNLTYFVCSKFNRQGTHCKECIDGYGPAPFLNGANIPCAKCHERNYIWIFYLLLQLLMVTILFFSVLLCEIQGTSSPVSVLAFFHQILVNNILTHSVLYSKIVYQVKPVATIIYIILTTYGFWNLDFFRYSLPPVCVSSSMSNVHTLLFEYIIAFYPIFLTLISYFFIRLYNMDFRLVIYVWKPFYYLFTRCKDTCQWNPMKSLLNTFATFFLLSYSKILFTSANILSGVKLYDNVQKEVNDSPILLYDSSLKYFGHNHAPYVCLSLSIILIFNIIPPSILLLYPTKCFKLILEKCGFKRRHALAIIMDVFQGWYKDGTNGTRDYRALSALYMILRICVVAGDLIFKMFQYESRLDSLEWNLPLILYVGLGCFFLVVKPYKKSWMNTVDGLVLILLGMIMTLCFTIMHNSHDIVSALLLSVIPTVTILTFRISKCFNRKLKHHKDSQVDDCYEEIDESRAGYFSDNGERKPLLSC